MSSSQFACTPVVSGDMLPEYWRGHTLVLFVGAMAEAVSGTNSPAAAFDALYNAPGTNACTKTDRSSMTHVTDI